MIIDAHIHYGDDDPALLALLEEFDLKLMNICVAYDYLELNTDWHWQLEEYASLHARFPQRFAWCTTFDVPGYENATYVDEAITGLERDFAAGASACKLWKNVGMDARKPDGSILLIDDPVFDPIFEHLAAQNRTLLLHIAEPIECWQPLEPGTPFHTYYSRYPRWHMYGKPEYPSHAALMAARDHVMEKHPTLRVVGAHLGSLEYSLEEVARRFDRYPNFAVDISARLVNLFQHAPADVRRLFERHPDRMIFGTDVVITERPSQMAAPEHDAAIQSLRDTYQAYWAYFESDEVVTYRGLTSQGVKLPAALLDLFYTENARRWYPGL
jgi:predicted TIM-barrel fold metal-dependent hydrolase